MCWFIVWFNSFIIYRANAFVNININSILNSYSTVLICSIKMEVRFEMDDFISFFFYHRISNNFPPKNCFTEMVNVFSSKINFMEIVFEFNYLQFYAFPYRGRVWSMASDVYMHCFYSVENCIKMLKCAREKKNEGKITGREITRHQPEARNGQRLFILRYVVYAFAISIRHACELCIKHEHWAWWRNETVNCM